MPVFIILVWVFASCGLKNLSRETLRKIIVATVTVFLTCFLVFIHYRYGRGYFAAAVEEAEVIDGLNSSVYDISIGMWASTLSHVDCSMG